MLSKLANVEYNPSARCARWDSFITEIMAGDDKAVKFLRRATGYAISGRPVEDCLFILYGEKTRNGKTTFCRSVLNVVGDYGKSAQPESIAVNRNKTGSGPTSDIARLCGARFVNMAEPDKTMVLDAALVKSLTGRDEITARYLHKEFFSFVPHFVLFMNTNYLPRVDDITLFTSGRIFCIPFPVHFTPDKQERGLVEQFNEPEAASAILNWILQGYAEYQAEGIKDNVPGVVKEALQEYEESSDTFGQFLGDCVSELNNSFLQSSSLYQVYCEWTQQNGFRPMSQKNTISEMKRRGYKSGRGKKSRGFRDIVISPYFPRERKYHPD